MKMVGAVGVGSFAGVASAATSIGAMIPGTGWVKSSGEACQGDGTPLQFIPKKAPDEDPLKDELVKYPKCPYCGMDRTQWNHSRHLVHYDDGLVDGTCSIHCLAISLSLNLDRGPKVIYGADFGATAKIKPLVPVDGATYLIGSSLKGTMTKTSKMAFASADTARATQTKNGGELVGFDDALKTAYLSMANDTMMIRKRRAERVRRMKEKMKGKGMHHGKEMMHGKG
ncbi:MAG: twin-arginine translocation pathway signal protein [Gammaproteobacteria bacterium]|nr:twin-arginine translocation pathway signal protein [Gammaproteobacteria bacterium]